MSAKSQVEVVLSDDLWKSLGRRARELGVPLELLAAGLVCDTIQAAAEPSPGRRRGDAPSRVRRPRTESHRPARTVRH
ncbi:hypothetical protein OJF2_13970 [Aquisphaera giovannonii]|uniref:Uncharacterized protein n=1 Tax=Aquisphaera giovannonii TaxID=406548 RepID=A0A5B9VXC0_9BACT|nr:hypothetical protein [Aquisphaera giovannonii]QEH32912.1 hypothetical protein OJF2_13970 [Aquisphaera giovannonii]